MFSSDQLAISLLFAFAFGLGSSFPLRCECAEGDEAEYIGELLLTGARDARDRLRSGIVRARGEQFEQADDSTTPIAFYAAFDVDESRVRFDYTRHARFHGHDGDKAQGKPWSSDITQYFIRRADASIRFQSIKEREGPGEITIWPPDRTPPSGVTIYDVRAIGLLTREAIQGKYSLAEVLDKTYVAHPPSEVVDEGAGTWRLSHDAALAMGTYRYTLWVDREHGFSPTRLEESARPALADPKIPNRMPWTLQFVSTATWKEINGVWVPQNWHIEERLGKRLLRASTYDFEWLSVNERPAAELFTVESLNAADGTLVTNATGQHPFIDHVIGDPDSVLKGTVFGQRGTLKRISWTWTQTALLAIGLVLAGALAAIVLGRRHNHGQPSA